MTDAAKHLGLTLQDYLDGRIYPARRAEVRAHLEGCPQCRRELEALGWARDVALKRLVAEPVPPTLAGRVANALDEEDRQAGPAARAPIGPRWRKWAGAG